MSGYPRTPSSIDSIIPPASVLKRRVVRTTMRHLLLPIVALSAGISGNLMLFSMITYPFKLLEPPNIIVVAAIKFYSSFCSHFKIFFLEQFCDLQLKRNVLFLICATAHHTTLTHMYHKLSRQCIPLVREHPKQEEFVDCLVSAAEASATQGACEVSHIHQFNHGVASQVSVDSLPFKLLLVRGHCSVKVLGENTLTVPWSSPSTILSEYFSGLSFNVYSSVHRLYGAQGAYSFSTDSINLSHARRKPRSIRAAH